MSPANDVFSYQIFYELRMSVMTLANNDWYVVHRGRQTGLFSTWEACHAQINGFKGACYRGTSPRAEALVALGSDEKKIEIRRIDGHPNNRRSRKDVI
jgi:viroplasmin and RNaseH domain-containing protein